MQVDNDSVRAEKLLAWLVLWSHDSITLREICQRAPRSVRKQTAARRITSILERLGCLERVPEEDAVAGEHRLDVWRIVRRGAAVISYDQAAACRWRLIWVDQIVEVERALGEAVARIQSQRGPCDVSAYRWGQYRSDVAHLVEVWGHCAARLGLQLGELIGWDGMGSPSGVTRSLAWKLAGRTITHLDRDIAICGRTIFRRVDNAGWWMDPHLLGHEKVTA